MQQTPAVAAAAPSTSPCRIPTGRNSLRLKTDPASSAKCPCIAPDAALRCCVAAVQPCRRPPASSAARRSEENAPVDRARPCLDPVGSAGAIHPAPEWAGLPAPEAQMRPCRPPSSTEWAEAHGEASCAPSFFSFSFPLGPVSYSPCCFFPEQICLISSVKQICRKNPKLHAYHNSPTMRRIEKLNI